MNEFKLFKGHLKTFILRILSVNKRLCGYALIKKIKELTFNKWQPTTGSIYPLLKKMKKEKLIIEHSLVKNNRKLKEYSISVKGKRFLEKKEKGYNDFIQVLRESKKKKINLKDLLLFDPITKKELKKLMLILLKIRKTKNNQLIIKNKLSKLNSELLVLSKNNKL